jgi:outer membrane murein-binding lipoprotein Lpp
MVEGRPARLEGLVERLRTSQTITFSAVALVGAMLLALGSWTVIRIDGLAGRLDGKIDSLSARMDSRIDSLSARIDNLSGRIEGRLDGFTGNIASVNSKVDQLPAKINADLLALVTTLSQAITAAKQPPPQIILMPALQAAPSTTESAKPAPGTP